MAFLPQVYTFNTMPAGASLTSGLPVPGNYLYMYLIVPTMSAGYSVSSTPIYLQGSADGVTYYRYSEVLTTSVSNDFSIASSVSSRICYLPNLSTQYLKLEISGTATSVATQFKLICVSNQ